MSIRKSKKYPYIGKTKGSTVVLFTAKSTGICLFSEASANDIGKLYISWNEELFTVIRGTQKHLHPKPSDKKKKIKKK